MSTIQETNSLHYMLTVRPVKQGLKQLSPATKHSPHKEPQGMYHKEQDERQDAHEHVDTFA